MTCKEAKNCTMRTRSHSTIGLVLICLTLTWIGCDRKPTAIETPIPANFPATPDELRAIVGNQLVILNWNFIDSSSFSSAEPLDVSADSVYFRIYRATGMDTGFSLYDSSAVTRYEDRQVQNNVAYRYKLSAVNAERFEGKRSPVLTAMPGEFSILIDNGAEYTGTVNVTLSFTASTDPSFMMVGTDPGFAGVTAIPFTRSMRWTLTLGDGIKRIWAKFLDETGTVTTLPVSDSIILDTRATINAVTENTGGVEKIAGEIIHFTVDTGEERGIALVSIENGPTDIILYDDGTHGDPVAGDGRYEVDWVVSEDADVFQVRVVGDFTDRVGNKAIQAYSATRLTIKRVPVPVTLFSPQYDSPKSGVQLNWTQSEDNGDFAAYLVYRSTSAGVTEQNSTRIAQITDKRTLSFLDTGIVNGITYYYRVYVLDKTNLTAGSNEKAIAVPIIGTPGN